MSFADERMVELRQHVFGLLGQLAVKAEDMRHMRA